MFKREESAFYKVLVAFINESKDDEYRNNINSRIFAQELINDYNNMLNKNESTIAYYKNLYCLGLINYDVTNFVDDLEACINKIKSIYKLQ